MKIKSRDMTEITLDLILPSENPIFKKAEVRINIHLGGETGVRNDDATAFLNIKETRELISALEGAIVEMDKQTKGDSI